MALTFQHQIDENGALLALRGLDEDRFDCLFVDRLAQGFRTATLKLRRRLDTDSDPVQAHGAGSPTPVATEAASNSAMPDLWRIRWDQRGQAPVSCPRQARVD